MERPLKVEESNWGCEGTGAGGAGLSDLIRLQKWFSLTRAGKVALKYFSVSEFLDELKPEFFLIHGDAGMYDTHDGIYFTPGDDTFFLEHFSTRPFRFDRMPNHGGRESTVDWFTRLIALLAHYLTTKDISSYPKIEDSFVETETTRFKAVATINPRPDAVRIWWSYSDNRPFDDMGNPPWTSVTMTFSDNSWVSPWITIPGEKMIGWYVEAENTLSWEGLEFVQRDTSPQRFFNEFPPLTCPDIPNPDCSFYTPFKRGDANSDGSLNIADVIFTLSYLFKDAGEDNTFNPNCFDALDANDDGSIDISDPIKILGYLFNNENPLPKPFEECDIDPVEETPDLGCEQFPPCE